MAALDYLNVTQMVGRILASSTVVAASTPTTIYTVPANSAVKIASGMLCNTSTSAAVIVNILVVPNGAADDQTHRIAWFTLQPNDSTTLPEIAGAMLGEGDHIVITASVANAINYLFTGSVAS